MFGELKTAAIVDIRPLGIGVIYENALGEKPWLDIMVPGR